MEIGKTLGLIHRSQRTLRGLTQHELGEAAGQSQHTSQPVEAGRGWGSFVALCQRIAAMDGDIRQYYDAVLAAEDN